MDSDDLALRTLLSVRATLVPHLDEELVRQCYEIQKRHQFNRDRAQSSAAIERLIDACVAKSTSQG